MQWLNQLFHSIAGIAYAWTEILRFLHDIRETERESELLERMGGKHYYPDADISEALKRSKKYKCGQ